MEDDFGEPIIAELEPGPGGPGRSRLSGIKKWLAKPHKLCSTLRLTVELGSDVGSLVLREWGREMIVPALADDIVGQLEDTATTYGGTVSGKLTQHAAEDGRVVATKPVEWRSDATYQGEHDGSQRGWSALHMKHFETQQRMHNGMVGVVLQQMQQVNAVVLRTLKEVTVELAKERRAVDSARLGELQARIEAAQAESESDDDGELVKEAMGLLKVAMLQAGQEKASAALARKPPSDVAKASE